MDKIFHSTFDFFTHALPGVCVVLSFMVLDPEILDTQDLLEKVNKIEIGGGVFISGPRVRNRLCYPSPREGIV
jgi:hypothetical protein